MKDSRDKPLSLEELAAEAGVPARTIRFYIARGLLPRPAGAGRGAAYGSEHVTRLRTVKRLQGRGLMLAEISRVLGGEKPRAGLPAPSAWWSYPLADEVVVWVRAGLSPWRTRQVRAALEAAAARLSATSREEDTEHGDR